MAAEVVCECNTKSLYRLHTVLDMQKVWGKIKVDEATLLRNLHRQF